jgi:2-dehydro-3-deoxy-D-arabinonate dehydratase
MQLCKILDQGAIRLGIVRDGFIVPLDLRRDPLIAGLGDILAAPDPMEQAMKLADVEQTTFPLSGAHSLAPIDRQEVWAAGVTYKRSKVARESESASAASFYDKVYTAPRPELFFKATPERVVGPGTPVRIRQDSKWSVPEPELALFVSPDMRIVGYTIGNDMSARDIEGENPLYLPQAKLYNQSCALGPVVTLPSAFPPAEKVEIKLTIERNRAPVFQGATKLGEMARSLASLVEWLGRDNSFPHGAILLTGTGIVPPDDFTLQHGDKVSIEITGIGKLVNPVVQG